MAGKEENDFRRNIHGMCEEIVKIRQNEGFYERMQEVYPPQLSADVSRAIWDIGSVRVNIYLLRPNSSSHIDHTLAISLDDTPHDVIRKGLGIFRQLKEVKESECDVGSYLLKVVGAEEYLYGEQHIARYMIGGPRFVG